MNINKLKILLPDDEMDVLQNKVREGETPLWKYWNDFVTMYSSSNKSIVTIEHVWESIRLFLRHSTLITFETWDNVVKAEQEVNNIAHNRNWTYTTKKTYLKNLKTYFLFLQRKRLLAINPLDSFETIAPEKKEQYTLSQSRALDVIKHICVRKCTEFQRKRDKLYFELMYYFGPRPIELINSSFNAVSSDRNKITIQSAKLKSKPRYYRLPTRVRETLNSYIQHVSTLGRQEELLHHLFLSSSKHTGWTMKGISKLYRQLTKELGFKVTSYAFRRMVATTLHNKEMPLRKIQLHLGHTRQSTTEGYIQRCATQTEEGIELMDSLYESNSGDVSQSM